MRDAYIPFRGGLINPCFIASAQNYWPVRHHHRNA
jgi:lipoyl(octanoyl) transferase